MSTSLLYHAFSVRTYEPVRTEYRHGAVYQHLQKKRYAQRCSACRYPGVTQQGRSVVTVRTLPIGKRPVFLVLHLPRLRCRRCGKLRQDCRDVAPARKSYTFALATLVLDLCKEMSLSAVAKHLQLDWHLCKDILKTDLSRRRQRLRLRRVHRIAIDEIFVKSPSHLGAAHPTARSLDAAGLAAHSRLSGDLRLTFPRDPIILINSHHVRAAT